MFVAICYSSNRKLTQYVRTEKSSWHTASAIQGFISPTEVETVPLWNGQSLWPRANGTVMESWLHHLMSHVTLIKVLNLLVLWFPPKVPTATLEMKSQHINLGGIKHLVQGINLLTFVLDLRNWGKRGRKIPNFQKFFFYCFNWKIHFFFFLNIHLFIWLCGVLVVHTGSSLWCVRLWSTGLSIFSSRA